jgi:hypothetical protein
MSYDNVVIVNSFRLFNKLFNAVLIFVYTFERFLANDKLVVANTANTSGIVSSLLKVD